MDSDYSASVLPFLLFPVQPHSCFPSARLRSRFLGFPALSCLISHAFLPGSCTRHRCSFLFALPCFAPTAVPQVLTFRFHFRYFPLPFRFLSSASVSLPATQPSVSSFPSLPGSASQLLPQCPSPLSLPRSPRSLLPDFSCIPSQFLYSALLMVSFRPSLIRSRSCSSGAYLVLSLSVFSLSFRFLSSASVPVLATQPSVSSFPSSSLFRLTVAFQMLCFCLPASSVFSLPLRLVSHASLPFFGTQLPVRFLSSFPASLPQPFHWCLPCAFAFGLGPFSFRFLSSASFPGPTTQPSPFLFPSSRSSLAWFLRCLFIPVLFSLLPCLSSRFGTQLAAIPFSWSLLRLTAACAVPRPFLAAFGLFPLVNTLGSGYLAGRYTLKTEHRNLISAIT